MSRIVEAIVHNWATAEKDLTAFRFSTYSRSVMHDRIGALWLYSLNIQASAQLYCWLGFLEVLLRNALIRALRGSKANNEFDPFDAIWEELTSPARSSIENAKKRLRSQGKQVTTDGIVTELPFGFWRYLLASRHQNTLWRANLRHAFPGLWPQTRAAVYGPLEQAVALRNRIAHHEPIFVRNLGQDLAQIQQIIGWISPQALEWAKCSLPTKPIEVGVGGVRWSEGGNPMF